MRLSLVLDALLFWAPQAHYNDLRRVCVDDSIIPPRWKAFSRTVMAEWNAITIYVRIIWVSISFQKIDLCLFLPKSTVMLAVDVSFLAIPNVNSGMSQSVGIISTYISIIFIMGSLIVSILLVARQSQIYGADSAEGAVSFFA
jgi:hypothetical protein